MRARLIVKIFFLFFFLFIFNLTNFAQEEPQAVVFYKFDTNEIKNSKLLIKKLDEFINRLSREPETTRGFIAIAGNTKLAEKIKSFVADNSNLANRIVFNWNLKHPNLPITYFNFYLVPLGAKIPYVNVHEPFECPNLSIEALTKVLKQKSVITFIAKAEGGDNENVTYNWKISAGKIIKGQKTSTIIIDPQGAKEITATIEIDGVYDVCQRENSLTTKID